MAHDLDIPADPLAEIGALNAAMLDGARRQDWIDVANLEAARAALLKGLFESGARPEPQALARTLEQVLAHDRELLALAEPARARIGGELVQFQQARRARTAYTDTQAGGE
jgi:hypothetical protein